MVTKTETKHDRFLRLAPRRLERAFEELRLISQLSSSNYQYTSEEADEIVRLLDEKVRHIAAVFGVGYATRINTAATQVTNGARPIGLNLRKAAGLDEAKTARALAFIRAGRHDEAESLLRSAVVGRRDT